MVCCASTIPRATALPDQVRPWTDYRVILWVGDSVWKRPDKVPLFLERLRELGVDTAMVHGTGGDPQPWAAHQFPFYVENLVNRGLCLKWNSRVADWDRFVTGWATGGRAESAFVREYCFDDPRWYESAREQMRRAAQRFAGHAPLAYDIRDELSVTISANPFDYDFSPAALTGFREWLKAQYAPEDTTSVRWDETRPGLTLAVEPAATRPAPAASADAGLAALNAEWETQFLTWDAVRPFTTDQIKHRMARGEALPHGRPDWQALQRLKFDPSTARGEPARWNLAPWADFRTYMDLSLARTLDGLRQAAREFDPATPVGIEGTQMPSAWGGYDLWRLSQVLDWIEPYDIGNAREILGSFMPGKPILTTVFEQETNAARRRLWHLLLEGDRGCILWWSEDCIDWSSPEYALTAKAKPLAPVFRELKSPLARLFLRAERVRDPIHLHYSQPSIQVAWLLESTVDGATWHRRFSSFEAEHNRHAKARNAWLKALQDLGFSPQFIASEQLERLQLGPADPFTLVLPRSYALSDREVSAIASAFTGPWMVEPPTRVVLADGTPGAFDEHGRLRTTNALGQAFPADHPAISAWRGGPRTATNLVANLEEFPRQRLAATPQPALWTWLEHQLGRGAVRLPPSARARVHRFRVGDATLVAVERNIEYLMSENLRQAGGNEALEGPVELTARLSELPQVRHIYDLRAGRKLAHGQEWTFTLDPWQPSLFALLPDASEAAGLVTRLLGELDRAQPPGR